MNKIFNEIIAKINESEKIGIISHINPDGDNLGSLLGLSNSLRKYGKEVESLSVDGIPDFLKFLPGLDRINRDYDEVLDLLICVDCSDEGRLGSGIKFFNDAKFVINIDHHKTNTLFGGLNLVDSKASATGELVYELITNTDLPMDADIATCLYTAINTDTGSFKYSSTTPKTHRIAANLLEYGIDTEKINSELYQNNTYAKIELFQRAVARIKFAFSNSVAYTYLLKEDFEEFGAKKSDIEGLVELVRDIKGVEIAFILKEEPTKFKGSFRSKGDIDVSIIASGLNGGGHKQAAGFNVIETDIDIAIQTVLDEIDKGL
ncbi:MAG: bifunctional oligoribonuclease/PAP phosphatase NrnA [Tissierellia bacterium]|nr:bifunctional oligoribonuclease/PAP phosphatase NrnA [Tissierellia bacterium]